MGLDLESREPEADLREGSEKGHSAFLRCVPSASSELDHPSGYS